MSRTRRKPLPRYRMIESANCDCSFCKPRLANSKSRQKHSKRDLEDGKNYS